MTKVKICGLRDLENTKVAVEAGADLIGAVFVEGVRRNVSLTEAEQLFSVLKFSDNVIAPKSVGLFANQSLEFVNKTVEILALDYVQLCGSETLEYCSHVNAEVIKQYKIKIQSDFANTRKRIIGDLEQIHNAGHLPLLDRFEQGSLGGTGKTFDWSLVHGIAEELDFMLAGGLTPANVGSAINSVSPWGVDVSSGVETDLAKDPQKITDFIAKVHLASY